MELKTLTWNIGGGKPQQDGADSSRIASYAENGLDAIAGLLKSEGPDVIALQETQRKEGYDQAELIASSLGYEHYFHDSTSESHIDADCRLGHCVISKYPISQHRFGLFENPDAQVTWEDGGTATTHDKGFSSCVVSIGDTQIEVQGTGLEVEAHRVGRTHRPLSRHSHVRGPVATCSRRPGRDSSG